MAEPRRGTLTDLVNGLLDRGYEDAARSTLNSVAGSVNDPNGIVQKRLGELESEARRLVEESLKMEASNPVLRALYADYDDVMRANERLVVNAASGVQSSGSSAAGTIQRQLALGGTTDADLARIGVRWNVPDPEAVNRLVGYSQDDAFTRMIRRDFGQFTVGTIQNQAVRGIASGWSPLRTAREIRRTSENMPGHAANNLMRTLQLTSYRDSTAIHQQANVGIIADVIRIAALDDRTCLSCISEHGKVIWTGERNAEDSVPRVNDHHSGRCTSVVRVRGRQLRVTTGEQWFDSLPRERQLTIAGPANLAAMDDGAVNMSQFSQPYTDDTFGEMLREASLVGILGRGASRYYGG